MLEYVLRAVAVPGFNAQQQIEVCVYACASIFVLVLYSFENFPPSCNYCDSVCVSIHVLMNIPITLHQTSHPTLLTTHYTL